MKKIITTLCAAALLVNIAALTGCKPNEESPDTPNSPGGSSAITDSSDNSENSGSSSAPESAPEPPKPDGEATFLTCPDGTVIYTSQITKYQDRARYTNGSQKQYPIDTFNMETFTDNTNPQVVCEGFAYGFIPRYCVNITEAPEKFTNSDGIDKYSGEELPPSNEYFKIEMGDKFGSLTVKSAQSIFSNTFASSDIGVDPDNIPGIYLSGAEIKYEGEVEMTGFVDVMKTEWYDTEGDLWFYPDGSFVSKIPAVSYQYFPDLEPKGIYHKADGGSLSYGELNLIRLGNMFDYDIDFDGLEPGDSRVRVKLTVKDPVVSTADGYMNCHGEPAAVEVLR